MTKTSTAPYWFPSTVLEPGPFELHPIYIYHLPKTGSTTVFSSLRAAFDALFKILKHGVPDFTPPLIERLDDPKLLEVERFNMQCALIASHHPFGFHTKFAQQFKLITILRDPYRRVLSSYTYECMRANVPPSAPDFETMFRDEENRNVMVKQLSGLARPQSATPEAVQKAIAHLNEQFFMFGTTRDIATIISTILKINKMPNVICDHLNNTAEKYLLDGRGFEDEIRNLNQLDQELFAFVDANPRVDIDVGEKHGAAPPHQHTVLIKQIENATRGAFSATQIVETKTVIDAVKEGRYPKAPFDKLFKM